MNKIYINEDVGYLPIWEALIHLTDDWICGGNVSHETVLSMRDALSEKENLVSFEKMFLVVSYTENGSHGINYSYRGIIASNINEAKEKVIKTLIIPRDYKTSILKELDNIIVYRITGGFLPIIIEIRKLNITNTDE